MNATGTTTASASPLHFGDTLSFLSENCPRLVFLQSLVAIALSYTLLFSDSHLLTRDQIELVTLGLLLAVGFLMTFPAHVLETPWFTGGLVLLNTAVTTTVIYLSGNAASDLYLTYFLILLLVATVPRLRDLLILSVIVCAAYGGVLLMGILGAEALSPSYLLRIPVLLTMSVFYGLTAENLVTDRGDRRILEERLEKLKRVQAGILKRSRELEHHVDTLKAERTRLQAQVRVRPSQTPRADNGVMQHARLETAIRLGEGLAKGLEADLSVIGTHSSRLLVWLAQEEAYRQPMEAIFQAGDRLATKVGDLRAFTRLDTSERELLSLNVAVRALEPILRGQLGDDIEVHFALQPDLPLIQADPVHLERSVLCLTRNAQEAMPLGGDLTIETKTVQLQASSARQYPGVSPGRYVRLSIQDTGCGMDPDTKAHMFEPFYSTKSHGPGLGLSLVYALAQKAGGLLTVDSHLGRGTTASLYWPVVQSEADAHEVADPARAQAVGVQTVLVADEDEKSRMLLMSLLEGHGYTVLSARSDREAVELAERYTGTIHLLLTSLVGQGQLGSALAEQLTGRRPNLKTLLVGGFPAGVVELHGLDPAGYVQKPLVPTAFLQKVRTLLATG